MRYNSQTPPEILEQYVKRNDERWEQLNNLILSVISDGVKYLFLVNAGGCVAMLAFLGTSPDLRATEWPWCVLFILFLGVIFVGILHFSRYHVISYLQDRWTRDVVNFYEGNSDYSELSSKDDKRVKKTQWILIFAYLSFLSFIVAGFYSYKNYESFVKKGGAKMEQVLNKNLISPDRKNHVPRPAPVAPPPQPPK